MSGNQRNPGIGRCHGCCYITVIGILCCGKTTKSSQIKILWAWLVLLAAIASILLGCVMFRPLSPYAAVSDMRPVRDNVDFLFCEEVGIESPGLKFDAYQVKGELKIDPVARNEVKKSAALFVETNSYNFLSFYFLKQSKMTMDHCSKAEVVFYVFKGQDNFDTWKNDRFCEECYMIKHYLTSSRDCNLPDDFTTEFIEFIDEDQYFVVYENNGIEQSWVDINIMLNRSIYALENATVVCSDVVSCNVVLEDPSQTAVFQVNSYYDIGDFNHPVFKTRCIPRMWSYLIIHGGSVLILGVLGSLLIQKFCRNHVSRMRSYDFEDERAPLLYDALPPSYSSVVAVPPKYEDIVRNSEMDPPSYEDAVIRLSENRRERGSVAIDTASHSHVSEVNVNRDTGCNLRNECTDRANITNISSSPLNIRANQCLDNSSRHPTFTNTDIITSVAEANFSGQTETLRITPINEYVEINSEIPPDTSVVSREITETCAPAANQSS